MQEAFINLLLSDAAVQSVVSNRINWVVAPQGSGRKPYLILQRVSGNGRYHSQGSSGYRQARIQIDAYGESYSSAVNVSRFIGSRLSGYRDANFQGIFLDSERDLPAADAGDVTRLFRVSCDYIVHYRETLHV